MSQDAPAEYDPATDEWGRLYYFQPDLDQGRDDGRYPCRKSEANLLSSLCADGLHRPVLDLDFPHTIIDDEILDFGDENREEEEEGEDFARFNTALVGRAFLEAGVAGVAAYCRVTSRPRALRISGCRFVPSTTAGHHHLYIDQPLAWDVYRPLLRDLADACFLQEGFAANSIRRGSSFVRPPGVKKSADSRSSAEKMADRLDDAEMKLSV